MQRVTLVRYATKPGRAAENEALSRAIFTELRAQAPGDVAYALFKGRDGVTFVHLFVNASADDAAALADLPAFKAYQAEIADRCVSPPEVIRLGLDLIESYGLSAVPAHAA
jgi:quinol monooxygenase YgiN